MQVARISAKNGKSLFRSLVASQVVHRPRAHLPVQEQKETQVQFLEKEMAPCNILFKILGQRIYKRTTVHGVTKSLTQLSD